MTRDYSRLYTMPVTSQANLDLAIAMIANEVEEAKRIWIDQINKGTAKTAPLTPKEIAKRKAEGKSAKPLVGSGKFLRDVASWPVSVTTQRVGDVYQIAAQIQVGESVKVLRTNRDGEREIDIYTEVAKSGPSADYIKESLGIQEVYSTGKQSGRKPVGG
jgi:hypothetical protein